VPAFKLILAKLLLCIINSRAPLLLQDTAGQTASLCPVESINVSAVESTIIHFKKATSLIFLGFAART